MARRELLKRRCAARPQAARLSRTPRSIFSATPKAFAHNAFKIDLARRAIVRALTQAAHGTPQSQSDKKVR